MTRVDEMKYVFYFAAISLEGFRALGGYSFPSCSILGS